MDQSLPEPLGKYVQQQNEEGPGDIEAIYSPDARVLDEGGTIVGHDAIRNWKRASKARYRYRVEPVSAEQRDDGRWHLRLNTIGDFPGSPLVLDHVLTVAGGRIVELEIH